MDHIYGKKIGQTIEATISGKDIWPLEGYGNYTVLVLDDQILPSAT